MADTVPIHRFEERFDIKMKEKQVDIDELRWLQTYENPRNK